MTQTHVSRRSMAKGAAWTAPALAVAAAAPAMAASPQPSVLGASYYYDDYEQGLTGATVTGEIRPAIDEGACSYTVSNGPASVTNLSATYWLPISNYKFAAVTSNGWSTPTRDATKTTKAGPNTGLTYYPYTTTFAGTGSTSTTCGPTYSFKAPAVSTSVPSFGGAYYYQLSYALNGTVTTNPLRSINNP